MKSFAVIGNPIAHSKSPDVFKYLFNKFGLDAKYGRISLNRASDIFNMADKFNISGFNVTSPFKEEIFKMLKDTDPISKKIGAVNLVICKNGSYYGFNTDVYGIQHSLIFNNVDIKGRKCIVLGAGGAAKSAVFALKDLGGDVSVCNRTDEKAERISEDFECGFINYKELNEHLGSSYLLVTAVSEISKDLIDNLSNTIVLNANYMNPSYTDSCRRFIDGYEWLIYQAIKSFEIFFDLKYDGKGIRNELLSSGIKKNIALIGQTGSGKSTYAGKIAEHLSMEFYDTDKEIERKTGTKVADIFQTCGEEYFRKMEEDVLSDIATKENIIVSVGAGALSSVKNRESLYGNFFTVLLDTDTGTVLSRLDQTEISKRPMLKDINIKNAIETMFTDRKENYFSVADLIIKADQGSIEDIEEKIIKELDARQHFYK